MLTAEDFVIVINAEEVVLTGNKLDQKMMKAQSISGGLKETPYRSVSKEAWIRFRRSSKKNLPNGVLGRKM